MYSKFLIAITATLLLSNPNGQMAKINSIKATIASQRWPNKEKKYCLVNTNMSVFSIYNQIINWKSYKFSFHTLDCEQQLYHIKNWPK